MNKSRYIPIVLIAVLVSAGLGAFAYAAANNNSTEIIYACANRTNGQMRLASSPGDCKKPEIALSWNQAGPEGPEGPPGPPGSSAESFQIFTSTISISSSDQDVVGSAECGNGYIRVSLLTPLMPEGVTVTAATPSLNHDHVGTWQFENSGGEGEITLRILCMQLAE
jgi:hypothetical protein